MRTARRRRPSETRFEAPVVERGFQMSDVRAFWDSVAEIYDATNDNVRAVHDQRFVESFRLFPQPSPRRILVIWSRTGEAVRFLRDRHVAATVVNLEASREMLRLGARREHDAFFAQTDLSEFPIGSRSVDLVWSLETLEHCPRPGAFLAEARRVLQPGGTLILSCPPAVAELHLRVYERFATNHGEGPHVFPPSRDVKRWLGEAGLRLRYHRGTLFFPFAHQLARRVDRWLEGPMNKLGLSDLGIRQFFVAERPTEPRDD
jgi:SAM-dependent methyltransferase